MKAKLLEHSSGAELFCAYFSNRRRPRIPIDEQVEVVSLVGGIALEKEEPKLHAHVVACRDASAHGGHLLEAHVRPTLEVILEVSPARLQKYFDPASGLALIRI